MTALERYNRKNDYPIGFIVVDSKGLNDIINNGINPDIHDVITRDVPRNQDEALNRYLVVFKRDDPKKFGVYEIPEN